MKERVLTKKEFNSLGDRDRLIVVKLREFWDRQESLAKDMRVKRMAAGWGAGGTNASEFCANGGADGKYKAASRLFWEHQDELNAFHATTRKFRLNWDGGILV